MTTATGRKFLLVLMLTNSATSQANDIVDFLRAVNGVPERTVDHHSDTYERQAGLEFSSGSDRFMPHHRVRYDGPNEESDHYGMEQRQFPVRQTLYRGERMNLRAQGSRGQINPPQTQARITFHVGSGGYGPPPFVPVQQAPSAPLPPVEGYSETPVISGPAYLQEGPFQIGEIVDCPVPLATCVRVEDQCNIAPHAVPVVVAVKDPDACRHDPNAMVFVQVFTPPCPPRDIRISPCRTRVTMCFGRYEVEIKSKNGWVVVDYDN